MQDPGNLCEVINAGMTCHCDQGCHERGECCSDIGNTCPGTKVLFSSYKGLFIIYFSAPTTLPPTTPPPTTPPPTTPPQPSTCASEGHTGCCMRGPGNLCEVTNPGMTCYCDQECHERDDCCSDIANTCPGN